MVLLNFGRDDRTTLGKLTSFWLNGILLVLRYNRNGCALGIQWDMDE